MKVDNQLVDRLATLAKLEFDETAKEEIKGDLQKIIGFFQQISELDTDNVEPLVYMSDEYNVFREDEVKKLITKEEGLKNAPVRDSDYIKVPKVIQK